MARPPFWKRTYLLEPRLQIGITLYMLLFAIAALAMSYVSVKQSLLAVLENAAGISPSCHTLINENEDSVRSILSIVFGTNAVIMAAFALVGGILISHRIAGPLFRLKAVLRQILDGEDPGEIRFRKSDFCADLVPLLQELKKARSKSTEKV